MRRPCSVEAAQSVDPHRSGPDSPAPRVPVESVSGGQGGVRGVLRGPAIGASLAFGHVAPALAEPGTELDVVVFGERRGARVLGEVGYDPDNERPRA